MDAITHATNVIRQAENRLRELASQAAKEGDYSSVVQIAAWAQGINALVETKAESNGTHTLVYAGKIQRRLVRQRRSLTANDNNYPLFFRHSSQLIRVAWSKRDRKEYLHKAPFSVFNAITKSVSEAGRDGRVFSTDDILPISDDEGGSVPNYQAYVVLALLKHTGLIEQHGRQGYSIPRHGDFRPAIEALWKKLPDKSPAREGKND